MEGVLGDGSIFVQMYESFEADEEVNHLATVAVKLGGRRPFQSSGVFSLVFFV
jgi:hypothetical protein